MTERTINTAIVVRNEKQTVENINTLLDGKVGFVIRDQYNSNQIDFICCECGQRLIISYQKSVYLKHNPNSEHCILKDENVETELIEEINRINWAKESQRHFELKEKLLGHLENTDGVSDIESEQFKFNGKDRRKPDVFCDYKGKKIAFEIQLSNISQRYIFYRYNFYRELGIYLFWILDDFSKINQNQTDLDIKYLNSSQNIFELNENTDISAIFTCNYKKPFIDNLRVKSKWKRIKINLCNLHFNDNNFQAYYYDFDTEKKKFDEECKIFNLNKEKKAEEQRERQREQQELKAKLRADLVQELKIEEKKFREIERSISYSQEVISSIKAEISHNNQLLVNPEIEVNRLIFSKDKSVISSSNFANSTEEIKNNFDRISENQKKKEEIERTAKDYQGKIALINQFKSVIISGIEYKIIDTKKYSDYIKENKKRFLVAYTSSLSSNIQRTEENKTNTFEKMLSQPDRYSFLIILRKDIIGYNKIIEDGKGEIEKLQLDSDGMIGDLKISFVNWIQRELKQLEESKQKIEEELPNLHADRIDIKIRIDEIEYEQTRYDDDYYD